MPAFGQMAIGSRQLERGREISFVANGAMSMKPWIILAPMAAWLACQVATEPAHAQPSAPADNRPKINTLREIGPALRACFSTPQVTRSYTVTIRMSFNRRGSLIGRPAVTYSAFEAGGDREQVAAAITEALRRCTPLPFTDSLGNAVAGRIFTFVFSQAARTRAARFRAPPLEGSLASVIPAPTGYSRHCRATAAKLPSGLAVRQA
ncbi:hypothetical protein [Phreatobacter stygius]|uniref:TonB C-terminal domain-containing protein n=1 Tax=Phreatobacter stygius TaxID=1940610 RepID=A0A4D7AYY9_9HYPH|nr:hypothetical protein [Phreatobacter stygius]QCI62900.1 hypothetical protein E8M01_00745 [Phreatobacter stygius]